MNILTILFVVLAIINSYYGCKNSNKYKSILSSYQNGLLTSKVIGKHSQKEFGEILECYEKNPTFLEFLVRNNPDLTIYQVNILLGNPFLPYPKLCSIAEDLYDGNLGKCLQPSIVTFSILINAFGINKDATRLKTWIERMRESRMEMSSFTFGSIFKAFSILRDRTSYMEWLEKFKVLEAKILTTRLFNVMMGGLIDLNFKTEIYNYLDKLKSHKMLIEPTIVTYNIIIKFFKNTQDFDNLRYWIAELMKSSLQLDIMSYSILIMSYAEMKDREGLSEIEKKLLTSGKFIDTEMINNLVRGYTACEDEKSVRKWIQYFDSMNLVLDQYSFIYVFRAYAGLIDDTEGLTLWIKKLLASKVNINHNLLLSFQNYHAKKLSIVIQAFIPNSEYVHILLNLASEINIVHLNLVLSCDTFNMQFKKKILDELTFGKWKAIEPSSSTFSIVFSRFMHDQNASFLEQWLTKFEDSKVPIDKQNIGAILQCLGTMRQRQRFEAYLSKFTEKHSDLLDCRIYNTIIGAYIDFEDAIEFEKWVQKLTESGHSLNIYSYNAILKGYRIFENFNTFNLWAAKLQASGLKYQTLTYVTLIRAFGESQDIVRLKELEGLFHQSGATVDVIIANQFLRSFWQYS